MLNFKTLAILVSFLSWSYCKVDKYCSICEDHTMCLFQGIGTECQDVGDSGISPEDKTEILGVHNWLRRLVATGHEHRGSKGPQPKAADMMKMIWDNDLAIVAQRWADQCRFQHDTCRNDPRWRVGQNIYWKWKYPVHKKNWTEAIVSWYGEVALYDAKEVESYRFDSVTGHYTQLLWHDTYTVGCGRRDYGPNKLYVCNYGPAGNWLGEPMYEIGEPCSKCPEGTICDEYLCTWSNSSQKVATKKTPGEKTAPGATATRTITTTTTTTIAPTNTTTVAPLPHSSTLTFEKKTSVSKVIEETTQTVETQTVEIRNKNHKTHPHNRTHPHQKIGNKFKFFHLLLGVPKERTSTTNAINDDDVVLDPEIRYGLEDIQLRMEKLIKRAIKKFRSSR